MGLWPPSPRRGADLVIREAIKGGIRGRSYIIGAIREAIKKAIREIIKKASREQQQAAASSAAGSELGSGVRPG